MKNLCFRLQISLSLILTAFTFSLNAQSPVYFDPQAVVATVNINDSALVHSVLHNATDNGVEFYFPGYNTKGLGGPDAFGYTWIDSDEPNGPDWAWTEISEAGTLVEGLHDDNVVGPFNIGFDFSFYGQTKTQFWINSNGCVSFNNQLVTFANYPIPTNNDNTGFIAWFWDDLTMDTAISRVYYKKIEEQLIIQFNKIVHYPGTEEWITAQVVLRQNGTILVRYKQIREGFPVDNATVGLQSFDSQQGIQVVYNAPYLHSEMAVRFDLNRSFITSVSPASVFIPAGGQETIWIAYNSSGFPAGSYEQELKCLTSYPEQPEIYLHNVMHVVNPDQAGFKGYVTDAATGYAIDDVQVKVGEHITYTNDNGYYELPLEQGEYNVKFIRSGYQTMIVEDTTALPGFSTLDVALSGFYFIAGQVFAGENHIETGFAYGYKMLEGTIVDVFAEMVGEQGWYEFSGLAYAQYIIKAEPSPNSVYYGDYLPTYYGDVLHWEDATMIILTQSTESAHIHLVPVSNAPLGPGSISGRIDNGSDAANAANIPIILRTVDASAAYLTYSSTDGSFMFTGLNYGDYEIFAEIPGKSVIPEHINLDESHPSVDGIVMLILDDQIIFVGIEESEIFEVMPVIYPNPVSQEMNVRISLKKPGSMHISIADLPGRKIFEQVSTIQGEETILLNLESLSKGIYLLKIEAGQEVYVTKIIKK